MYSPLIFSFVSLLIHTNRLTVLAASEICDTLPILPTLKYNGRFTPVKANITIKLVCRPGYTRGSGKQRSITCLGDNKWTVAEDCRRKRCSLIHPPLNGGVSYEIRSSDSRPSFGTKAIFYCNAGYTLLGQSELFCEIAGTNSVDWSGSPPQCEIKKCAPPEVPANVSIDRNEDFYTIREVVKFSCPGTLKLYGPETKVCKGPNWHPAFTPKCVNIQCDQPEIEHAIVSFLDTPEFIKNIRVHCEPGYMLQGSSGLQCVWRKWNKPLPKCIPPSSTQYIDPNLIPVTISDFTTNSIFTTAALNESTVPGNSSPTRAFLTTHVTTKITHESHTTPQHRTASTIITKSTTPPKKQLSPQSIIAFFAGILAILTVSSVACIFITKCCK